MIDLKTMKVKGVTVTILNPSCKRILIVDDDPDVRHLIAWQLRLEHFETVEAADGRKALQLIESGANFDMIITDAVMPELDGFGLASALRSRPGWSEVPILMVTSLDDKHNAEYARKSGINQFLGKPLDRHQFKAAVHGLLAA